MKDLVISYLAVTYIMMAIKLASQRKFNQYDDVLMAFAPVTAPGLVLFHFLSAFTNKVNEMIDWVIRKVVDKMTGNTASQYRYNLYCETVRDISYYQWATMKKTVILTKRTWLNLACLSDSVVSVQVRGKNLNTLRVGDELPNLSYLDCDGVESNNLTEFFENLPALETYHHDKCTGIMDLSVPPLPLKHVNAKYGTLHSVLLPRELPIPNIILSNNKIEVVNIPCRKTSRACNILDLSNNELSTFLDAHGYLNLNTLNVKGNRISNKELMGPDSHVKFIHR